MFKPSLSRVHSPYLGTLRLGGVTHRSFVQSKPLKVPSSRPQDRYVVDSQDAEYLAACAAQSLLDEERQQREQQRILDEQDEEDRLADQIDLIQAKFLSLPPEPSQGTTIAININGIKKARRFGLDEPGEHLYYWVAAEYIAVGEAKDPDGFEVRFVNKAIHREETLREQKITGRVMVTVCEQ
jgi:hypothetical protein